MIYQGSQNPKKPWPILDRALCKRFVTSYVNIGPVPIRSAVKQNPDEHYRTFQFPRRCITANLHEKNYKVLVFIIFGVFFVVF